MNIYRGMKNLYNDVYYYFHDRESLQEGPLKSIPNDVLKHIFSLLNCCEVVHNIGLVNKKWNVLSDDAGLLKFLIYKDIVFKLSDWQKHLGLILDESENQKAWDALPKNIGKILKSPPTIKHQIVWIPKDTTINNFGELFKKINKSRSEYSIHPSIRNKFGDVPHQESGFVVMSLKSRSNSKCICGNVFDLKMSGNTYRKPSILESIVCLSAIYFKSQRESHLLYYRRVTMSNNHCQANGIRVNVSMEFLTEGSYFKEISVQYDPEPVYVPLNRTPTRQTHTKRHHFGRMK